MSTIFMKTGKADDAVVAGLIQRISKLRNAKVLDEAEALGKEATRQYPANAGLLSEHAETAVRRKTWGAAIERLEQLGRLLGATPERDGSAARLVKVFIGLGQPGEAMRVLEEALAVRGGSIALEIVKARLELLDPALRNDAARWEKLVVAAEQPGIERSRQVAILAACAGGLRLAGSGDAAKALLEKHYRPRDAAWEATLADGYSRLVLFDNGKTRIEYYQKLFDPATGKIAEPEHLAITFDLMEQNWDKEPFAYRPLSPRITDFLAVRKRGKEDFHQDLRRDDFLRLAGPLAARYREVVALGQSLGAYCCLYYASWLPGCRILATAPRNPLHPKYAGKRYANHKLFIHEYEMPWNPDSSPTIAYDPKNEEDGRYVEQSLAASFPQARILRYPYCGHSITRYLRDTGALKGATLGFFDGLPFPAFDKSARGSSAEYVRNLAKLNLRRGRVDRARSLARKALELGGDVERTEELLLKIEAAAISKPQPSDP